MAEEMDFPYPSTCVKVLLLLELKALHSGVSWRADLCNQSNNLTFFTVCMYSTLQALVYKEATSLLDGIQTCTATAY
jgi:hypothetical protein